MAGHNGGNGKIRGLNRPGHDIVVIGASAGGVEAVSTVVSALPEDFKGAVFVVLHIPADGPSFLPKILERVSQLPALHPADRTPIQAGRIYVAPPDHHLLVERGFVRVVRGPRENRHRPAVDPLFRTAALAYGPRVVGVVLTGSLDDGTAGLLAVKRRGGIAVVQDPAEALYSSMPRNALEKVEVDHVLPLAQIGPLLTRLSREPASPEEIFPVPENLEKESMMAEIDMAAMNTENYDANPSVFSCPECGGVLWELHEDDLTRFRCRVGHAFSIDSMQAEQAEALENALWVALKVLEENTSFSRRLASQARSREQKWLADRYEERISEGEAHSKILRDLLLKSRNLAKSETSDLDQVGTLSRSE